VATLAAGGLSIMSARAELGAVFVGLAICYTVVFVMVEPATARASFGDEGGAARPRPPSDVARRSS
jgi:hypothetical protein